MHSTRMINLPEQGRVKNIDTLLVIKNAATFARYAFFHSCVTGEDEGIFLKIVRKGKLSRFNASVGRKFETNA